MAVLLLNVASAAYMAGVSWLVSLVVYPAFALVGEDGWRRYHDAHRFRITFVVLPGMAVELGTSAWLALAPPVDGVPRALAWTGLVLAAATWAQTGLVAVPVHERLARAKDLALVGKLIRGHHVRTALWTAHAVVACLLLAGSV